MKRTDDPPKRLLHADSDADGGMRALLRSSSLDAPTAEQRRSLDARMAALVAGSMGGGAGATGGAVAGLSATAKIAVVAVVAATAVGGGYLATRHPGDRRPTPVTDTADERAATPVSRVDELPDADEPAVVPTGELEPEPVEPTRGRIAVRASGRPQPRVAPDEGAEALQAAQRPELTILHEARRHLREDPEHALTLCDEHERSWSDAGRFAEEREAIAVEALHLAGHDERARARFARLRARWPQSSYRVRLQAVLDAERERP